MTDIQTISSRLEVIDFEVDEGRMLLDLKLIDQGTEPRFATASGKIAEAILALGLGNGAPSERRCVKIGCKPGDMGLVVTSLSSS